MYGYNFAKHPVLDQKIICMWSEEDHDRKREVRLLPQYGANLYSYQVDGIEYLHQAPMPVIGKKFFGIPLLYPFPNRVGNCRFTFDGTEYVLPDNDGGRTLHGLISDAPFEVETPVVTDEEISVKTWLEIPSGHPIYKIFPIANRLEVTYTLGTEGLKLTFKVTNLDPSKRFPFGLGIHPYFNVHGLRSQVRIQVPAKKWMEAVNLMPTGKLVDLDDAPADLTNPTPLTGLNLDDVWYGMDPMKPMTISYDALGKRLSVYATKIFTHSVTFTPPCEAFFCLENQTNSTDCHNLYAKGLEEESHLLILNPGESVSGSILMKVESIG